MNGHHGIRQIQPTHDGVHTNIKTEKKTNVTLVFNSHVTIGIGIGIGRSYY